MRDVAHLASLIFNAPLLIRSDKGEQILNVLAPRVLDGQPIARADIGALRPMAEHGVGRRLAGGAYLAGDGVAVWPIVGSLVRRGGWLDAECGLMSYSLIADSALEVFSDSQVRGVLLELDTPGGEAAGCFDTAELLRAASEATGKPLWAHVNEEACSAGYALASAASQIWIARTGVAGSIGVVAAHLDVSEADKKAGVKWTFIHAGAHKVEGNMHEPLEPDALARFQADIDDLYTMFVDLVSQNRGMTADEIRGTNADIYRGTLAVEAGLADEVGTIDQALEAFAWSIDELQSGGGSIRANASRMRAEIMPKAIKASAEATETVVVDLPADDPATNEPNETESDEAADVIEDATEDDGEDASAESPAVVAERERCAGIMGVASQASRLGVSFDAAKAISGRMSVADARAAVLDAAAKTNEISGVAAPAPAGNTAGGGNVSTAAVKSAWGKALKRG